MGDLNPPSFYLFYEKYVYKRTCENIASRSGSNSSGWSVATWTPTS